MTRKSRRELEHAVDELLEERSQNRAADETFAERHYTDEIKDFVYEVSRDVMRILHDPEIGNLNNPERTYEVLQTLRETYEIETDSDDAVMDTLQAYASDVESQYWGPCDSLSAGVVAGPHFLSSDDRAQLRALVANGQKEQASQMAVSAVYHWLADAENTRNGVS